MDRKKVRAPAKNEKQLFWCGTYSKLYQLYLPYVEDTLILKE
jgi:hypothetical protein